MASGRLTGGNVTILPSTPVKLLCALEVSLTVCYFTHAFDTAHVSYANRMSQRKKIIRNIINTENLRKLNFFKIDVSQTF